MELVVKVIKGLEEGIYHACTRGIDSVQISGEMSVAEVYELIKELKEIPQKDADAEYKRLLQEDGVE